MDKRLELAAGGDETKDHIYSLQSLSFSGRQTGFVLEAIEREKMRQESWQNFITAVPLSRSRSSTLFILFKREGVDTGDPVARRMQMVRPCREPATWGEERTCSGLPLPGFNPLPPQ